MSKNKNLKVVHKKDTGVSMGTAKPEVMSEVNDTVESAQEAVEAEVMSEVNDVASPADTDPFAGAKWFDYADLVIKCKCGHTTKIEHPGFKQIKTGIQLPFIYTVKNYDELPGIPYKLSISCEECAHNMSLEFTESVDKPIEDAKVVEEVSEDTVEVEKDKSNKE